MSLIKNIYLSLINWRWELGISEDSLSEFVENGKELHFHWVKLPFKGRWFADPFILDYNEDEIIILVEEYSDKIKKGRIGKVVVDRKTFTFKNWKLLLELPTHLSFPAIIRRMVRCIFIRRIVPVEAFTSMSIIQRMIVCVKSRLC